VPIEAECLSPDVLAEKSRKEITALPIWEGNRERTLGELFKLEGRADPIDELGLTIRGDVSKVRRIGTEMSGGTILIHGNVGMHLGEEMKGGTITVEGNAGSWTGSKMRDGLIEVKGNAGDYIGAAYRGSTNGMRGGTIIIHGNAGSDVGCFMRNGLIKIHGDVGPFVGIRMRNGTIFVQGNSEARAGAEMSKGKIVIGGRIPSILPTFIIDDIRSSVSVEKDRVTGPFYRFVGNIPGYEGRLFVAQASNPHLQFYEHYL
jgi:formylmethanofuran dehydrogenase subunit C